MGQYFKAAVINGREIKTYSCMGFLKLMEHSYLFNPVVNQVMAEILDFPCRVIWVGDYAHLSENLPVDKSLLQKISGSKDEKEWDSEYSEYRADLSHEDVNQYIEDLSEAYLVNLSKKVFIDLSKLKKREDDKPKIHPLPILTSCGKGIGSGDYDGNHMELVGSWANDVIMSTYSKPEGLAELGIFFEEN